MSVLAPNFSFPLFISPFLVVAELCSYRGRMVSLGLLRLHHKCARLSDYACGCNAASVVSDFHVCPAIYRTT